MSRKKLTIYTGLALVMVLLVGCENTALTSDSESQVASLESESETSLDEQLVQAIADDDSAGVASLLEAGADPNAQAAPGRPVLFQAALHGKSEVAKLLIDRGADVHAETVDGAILVKAAGKGHEQIVKLLLDAGADVDSLGKEGANEQTAVFAAAISDDTEIVELLIQHGVDVNQTDLGGNTPLCIATGYSPNAETVSLLLENGANIDHQNDQGETALYQAVRKANFSNSFDIEIIHILLENGAALNIADDQGNTPLDLIGPETDIGKMLLEAGAGD
jgi:ankyrin repeat protein